MNKLLATAAIVIALASGSARAESLKLYGVGGKPGGCGEWAAAPAAGLLDAEYSSWLMGYLSALGSVGDYVGWSANITRGVPGSSVLMWMRNWCRDHPLDQAATGAAALVNELYKSPRPSG